MTKHTKKLLSFTLIICMLTAAISSTNFYGSNIMPRYNNVSNASLYTTAADNGLLTIQYDYIGSANITTKAVITTYIEKQHLGFLWLRVDIDTSNNEWVHTVNKAQYNGTRTFWLPSKGTYRTTVIYEISGTGGATDTITCQHTVTY